ncbi:hypothetical protein GNP80_05565 [Aliivibrio fischeri]|uniref:TFIIB-type zinc ribbon-containing protein n=1 Tax=Aliivibrio fischeri TaxID=668 RepID=UPI0012D92DCE|nr:TFIIB-type zinc ribbon-containing protein [Aliivibrio fischeri]MUK91903.1 hypothetical protein [Aliivibrio fischeri]
MYKCPKCKSPNTYKEKIMGSDTGDRVCKDCGHTTSAVSFRVKQEQQDKEV